MYQSNARGTRHALRTGIAVGAVQVGIAVVLLSTFAGGAFRAIIHKRFDPPKWTYVPPPRHSPAAQAGPRRSDTAPAPVPPIAPTGPTTLTQTTLTQGPLSPLPPFSGDDVGFLTDIKPSDPPPVMPPVAAKPVGDPAAWIKPDDYPWRALRDGWRGTTRLHLVIDSEGHVTRCTVTASSGHDALDAVACEKVARRARFSPARDGSGAPREGVYDNAIHWEIHEE
jgi:protein TonB